MTSHYSSEFLQAIRHFQYARWQATLEQLLARLTGANSELLSYEEVRQLIRARDTKERGLQNIPLDAIVGSVGRYTDFTRSFLPLRDSDSHRWASVEVGVASMTGLPPIEVYQIGDVYFVKDGNHRVSVARQLEFETIEAYVTEVQTKAPLTPDMQPDDIILAAEQAEFLERTRLDELRPDSDLRVTLTGGYRELLEHIDVHRYYMGLERDEEIPYEEAVVHWYDKVYLPVKELIQRRGLLRDFPDRTPLDLYVWIGRHRAALQESIGMEVPAELAAASLAEQYSTRPQRIASRVGGRLLDALTPDPLESGPAVGVWRREREVERLRRRLFANILVPITGDEEHWFALMQALQVARLEGGRVLGLHVAPNKQALESDAVKAIRSEFYRRCAKSGIPVQFDVEAGPVARVICGRARWTDLTVVRVVHPPAPNPIARLSSGIRTMLRRCSGPLLVAPRTWYALKRPLLAYNRTAKAQEALYLTAYLAGRWRLKPIVLASGDNEAKQMALDEARAYLRSQQIDAEYLLAEGPAAEAALQIAEEKQCDLIILGGYSSSPLGEMVRDSTVNMLLRRSRIPLLVCR